jgi:glutathione peroxidase
MAEGSFYDFDARTIDGEERSLDDYRGRVLLVVNVASKCGLTPQYAALERVHRKYAQRGFSVLGFPCNQFAGQEPGSDAEVREFCSTRYDVTFPLFSKIDVNGAGRAPLYAWLTSQATKPDPGGDVAWNFAKFVIDRNGAVRARFAPPVAPDADEVLAAIDRALED